MSNTPRKLTRNQLAEFLPNQRAVRAFEQMLKQVGELLPAEVVTLTQAIEAAQTEAAEGTSKANQALALLERIALALDTIALGPAHVAANAEGDLAPAPRFPLLGELANVAISTPAAGNLPIYNATVRRWVNALISAGANITVTNADGAITIAVSGIGTAAFLTADADGTLAANSDANIATQKSTKTYVDNAVTGLLDFKGSTNCAGNPNYPAALKGDAYIVSAAGKIGGAAGVAVDIGDAFVASADNAGGTQAAVGTSWFLLEHNLVGALLSANNLSDVANVVTARANLGLAIGTDVQAYDADLTTWAGITPAANVGAFLATPSSANLAAALTDEIGSGKAVFGTDRTAWTPADVSGAGLTLASVSGNYTQFGRLVIATFSLTYPATASGLATYVSTPTANVAAGGGVWATYTNYGSAIHAYVDGANTRFSFTDFAGNQLTNAQLSGKRFDGVMIYFAS